MSPPRVLFVCVGNSCRSAMAEGYARHLGGGVLETGSAGTSPAPRVSSGAVKVMGEEGVDITGHEPSAVEDASAEDWDLVVLMGPEVEAKCPLVVFPRREQWGVDDPYGGDDDDYRRARDIIRGRVEELVEKLGAGGPASDTN